MSVNSFREGQMSALFFQGEANVVHIVLRRGKCPERMSGGKCPFPVCRTSTNVEQHEVVRTENSTYDPRVLRMHAALLLN